MEVACEKKIPLCILSEIIRIIIILVKEDSSKLNRLKKSWIWQYFKEEIKEIKKKRKY